MDAVIQHKGRRYWALRTSALYAEEDARIDWASLLPSDAGSRHQRNFLTTASKRALEAMIDAPRRDRGILAHTTVRNWFGQLRRLVHWMALNEIWRFSDLSPDDAVAYLNTIKARRGSSLEVTLNTVQRHVNLLRWLWDLRSSLPDGLSFDITHVEQDALAAMRLRPSIPWRPICEADAMKLLNAARQWTDAYAQYVGTLLGRLWGEQATAVGLTRRDARRRRQAFYMEIGQEPQFLELANRLGMAESLPYVVLRAAVAALEGAAITSILLLVGLRAREAVRLDVDCVVVPDDGDPGGLLLAGVAAKKGGRQRTWAITSAVRDAVEAIRSMLAVPRGLSGMQALILQGSAATCAVFPSSRVPTRASPATVTNRMRTFARAAFPGDTKLARQVHAHAARKTFARFVVLRDKRVLESLAYHFGHTHRAITDGYYVGADMELALLLDGENREDLAQSLADLLSSKKIAGKASKAFIAAGQPAAGLRGKAALKSMVERLIAQGVQLAPCDWGYCVYSRSLSACHGDAKGPNEALRTADVCNGCSNFAVTERHRAWWEERVVRDERFLESQTPGQQALMVVHRRLSRSRELLAELNASRAPARGTVGQEDSV
jgi:integrase